MRPDFLHGITPGDVVYDIETYPNVFTFYAVHADTGREWVFEASPWRHDIPEMLDYLNTMRQQGCRMVGFNNVGFDYPVVHFIHQARNVSAWEIYQKAMGIIRAPDNARFAHMVWESDRIVEQIDLFKIHHFDNRARSTSLKVLEFNMRSDNVEDLPFDVGVELTYEQAEVLKRYNRHDVLETLKFYRHSLDQIRFREDLTLKYNRNFMNHNDTKIGKDYFIMRLEEQNPGCCYQYVDGKRHMVQTKRDSIRLADVIIPYIGFDDPEFKRILDWFKSQVITETKGVFKDVHCTVRGFQFDFGTGGIHGSIESQIVASDDDHVIIDLDVASYYPNLAIANGFYPEHLGQTFCTIYEDVYQQRKSYAKGTAENAMLKLALNGVYGDSNNQYSPFYDPQYTMGITINGQLLLCMLAEALMKADTVQMIQINTDGLTIRCPRYLTSWVEQIQYWWEQMTGLQLEAAEYSRMFIRDVNSYVAEYTDGKLKRKGAYEYDLGWHQNHSALVVPKAAEAALVHGRDIREFISNHDDALDFMLRTKVPRSSLLEWGGQRVANIVRYYISTEGKTLEKVMPPAGPDGAYKKKNGVPDHYYQQVLAEVGDAWDERIHTKNKSKYEERRMSINTGWLVTLCNDMGDGLDMGDLNINWYVKEAEKLVLTLQE
jgi:hypothetical protein